MALANLKMIEKYQQTLKENPKSQCFSALCEILRQEGHLEEAIHVAQKGLVFHPSYAAGRISLGRVYIEQQKWKPALKELELATQHTKDSPLAYKLKAQCYKELKDVQKSLQNYKMVLLLQPQNEKIAHVVKTLESLSMDEFEKIEDGSSHLIKAPLTEQHVLKDINAIVCFARAYMVRDELINAQQILKQGLDLFPEDESLRRTWDQLSEIFKEEQDKPALKVMPSRFEGKDEDTQHKVQVLESWLENIRQWRKVNSKSEADLS